MQGTLRGFTPGSLALLVVTLVANVESMTILLVCAWKYHLESLAVASTLFQILRLVAFTSVSSKFIGAS